VPRILDISLFFFKRNFVAQEPREQITDGEIILICSSRSSFVHKADSFGSGVLLSGGRHLTMFVM
jgi:hypothetical protein